MEMILLNDIEKNNKSFEDIKHVDENGIEFWYARELMPILQYSNWQNFEKIIFSAGKIGYQVEMSLENLQKVINFTLADIVD